MIRALLKNGRDRGIDSRDIFVYLSELQVEEATKVLFIADGAKWIWKRVAGLWNRLGLKEGTML